MRARRRSLGLATVNAEESLQRALNEAHGDERKLAPALTILAYTRRFAASVAALAIARHAADDSVRDALEDFSERATATLADLALALEEGRAPGPLVGVDVLTAPSLPLVVKARIDRLSRQITTLHDAVARMTPVTLDTGGARTVLVHFDRSP